MAQTTYNQDMTAVASGQIADQNPYQSYSYNNPADVINYGRMVQAVSGDANGVELPDNVNADLLGVAICDLASSDTNYPIKSALGVLRKGSIGVEVDDTVAAGDPVYVRIADTLEVSTLVMSGAGSGDFVSSNSIAITVNGTAITGSPLAFTTDNATTLAALAALLQATDEIYTAVSDGSHTITITSSNADMPVVNLTITGGATQATDTQTETVAGDEGDDQGIFRNDADSGKAILVANARFTKGASSGGNAVVELSLV